MKRKIMRVAAVSLAMALNCWPVMADNDETVTYPATDLSRPNTSDSEINTDKNMPGIQVREFDSNYEIWAYPNGQWNRIGDMIQYQGQPITLNLYGIRHVSASGFRNIDIADADEKGAGAVFTVTGPSVDKKLVTAAHDAVVKEYMGYTGREYEAEGEFDTEGYGAYTTNMFTDHLSVRLNNPYGSELAVYIPMLIDGEVSLDELKKYNSASEFVQATGYMQDDHKYTESLGTLRSMKNTGPYQNHHGNVQEMMDDYTESHHAAGWGIRKKYTPWIILKLPKNAPHLKEMNEYWKKCQAQWSSMEDPTDCGDSYEYRLAEYSDPIEKSKQRDYVLMHEIYLLKQVPLDASDHFECRYQEIPEDEYFIYFPFSDRQAINAWAAEMDSWEGHWQYFLYGTYYTEDKEGAQSCSPGYGVGNWGNTWRGIQFGQHTDHIPDIYEYTITAPGTYTITMTGTNHYHGTVTKTFTVLTDAFKDVNINTPHTADITWMYLNKISEGWQESDGTRTYRPMNTVVRQDMAAFLRREAVKLGVSDAATWKPGESDWNTFTDVNPDTPHAEDILWLAHAGISTGWTEADGTKTYRGMDTVKRQDMAAFLHRLASLAGIDKTGSMSFTDVNPGTPHAQDISWLGGTGISTGYPDGTYQGMTPVYRQDMAAFIHRLDDLRQ